jgi:hypothetical protein
MFHPGQQPAGTPHQHLQKLKADIHRKIVEMLDLSRLSRWGQDRLRKEVKKLAQQLVENVPELKTPAERERLVNEILDEVFGLGPLEPLMNDPTISDILVNGPQTVYVERNGRLEQVPVCFADNEHLMQMIQRIVARVGRRLDEMSPMVDARLPDGSRVNAIAPAAGSRWAGAFHSPFRCSPDRRATDSERHHAGRISGAVTGGGRSADQHDHFRRGGHRHDDFASTCCPAISPPTNGW